MNKIIASGLTAMIAGIAACSSAAPPEPVSRFSSDMPVVIPGGSSHERFCKAPFYTGSDIEAHPDAKRLDIAIADTNGTALTPPSFLTYVGSDQFYLRSIVPRYDALVVLPKGHNMTIPFCIDQGVAMTIVREDNAQEEFAETILRTSVGAVSEPVY